MEIIQGKYTRTIAAPELARLIAGYTKIFIDLGTGDGRFVLHTARQDPGIFAIGIDACRENLRESSRAAPANALFAIANVVGPDFNLVEQFGSRVAAITIHFPWGSLRDALISGDPALLAGLRKMLNPGGRVKVYLNASALVDASLDMDTASVQLAQDLASAGFWVRSPRFLSSADLRTLPSTWARRLAFGRKPEAIFIDGQKIVFQED